MKNPLLKRLPRELKTDIKKYLVLFIMFSLIIGVVSGVYVANNSMLTALNEAYEKYNIEDGHFNLDSEATDDLISAIEKEGVSVYEQFYKNFSEDVDNDGSEDATVRVFSVRDEVNLACIIEGELPTNTGEIAIDRMHADNNGIEVLDTIYLNGSAYTVTGLIQLSDYSTLYEDNSDFMFDALTFNVAVVTDEEFEEMDEETVCQYAFKYNETPKDTEEEKEMSDELMLQIATLCATGTLFDDPDTAQEYENDLSFWAENIETYNANLNELTDYVPSYMNNAMNFAAEDLSSDATMSFVLLIVFVIVLAFIFAITADSTIVREATAIGTMRALGYKKGELLRHYIALPVIVTLLSAIIGNILGYTAFKNVIVYMYYNSYSLPPYETIFTPYALVITTVCPVILMTVINILVVAKRLSLSPLKFLRNDLSTSKRKKAVKLPKFKFFTRFRMRIFFQNISNYLVLFVGIMFMEILLAFSIGMPATLENYINNADDMVVANYQYILISCMDEDGNLLETSVESAEEFLMTTLVTVDGARVGEDISVYGVETDSDYIDLTSGLTRGEVMVCSAYAEKFKLKEGDTITLKEQYTSVKYEFTIKEIKDTGYTMAIYMNADDYRSIFDMGDNEYSGIFSDEEITDISEDYIYAVLTAEDIRKIANQLNHSMGGMMDYFSVTCVVLAALIMYLITKLLIEKNAQSISMAKVLGYTNKEINHLYIRLTTVVVVISSFIASYLAIIFVDELWKSIMMGYNGWFTFKIGIYEWIKIVFMVIIAYVIVVLFDMRRVRRVPLTEALKNVE